MMAEIRYPESPLLKDITHELVRLYDDTLFHGVVAPEAILFVESTDNKAKQEKIDSGEAVIFEVKELPPPIAERVNADYMVVFHKLNATEMDGAKINALLLEALLKIKPGGGLRQPDVKTFIPLAQFLGPDWKRQRYVALDVRSNDLLAGVPRQARLKFDGTTHQPTDVPALAAELVDAVGLEGARAIAGMLQSEDGRDALYGVVQRARTAQVEALAKKGMDALDKIAQGAGGINLKPTERATLHIPATGEPTMTITGPDGTRDVPAVSTNVIPLHRPTGTEQGV